ncbi:uncharacterized protein STEHIDRAFT_60002 [Stereum hirsutum FP-91666 SS1]|uniref:uncharacterized protein n=1 Tax=Stereum hirsutum (strain FP-91666) TaxID=721885 RepID=UPI0004449AB8|nr:uncharacterized protein STEHIDRAFT_60002 [Stereum hirsutum FP-91666 SS1]EIM85322.1 hypothetical protein STEHIDRAFT_60002 [Stereum hirsutum FP-91666 SS1]
MGVGVGAVSPALVRFKRSWETFVDSLIKEWKTFNLVSALLLSAILTMFQIPTAAVDTVVRTPALLSMVCALMSLCYGCVYIVRFGTMRGMGRASRWAEVRAFFLSPHFPPASLIPIPLVCHPTHRRPKKQKPPSSGTSGSSSPRPRSGSRGP